MRRIGIGLTTVTLTAATLAAAALASASPAGAGAAPDTALQTLARWDMNESPGSTVLTDSGPNGLTGTIGSSVTLNGEYHSFPHISRGTGGTVDPQHLDTINSSALNPGTSDFIVTMRIKIAKPADSYGNVMQKGQTGTPGGFWKIQLDGKVRGLVKCAFQSPTGSGAIASAVSIADDQWHVVTCERSATKVTTTVDGVSRSLNHVVGNIANDQPLSIGGKHKCAAIPKHDCDYFIGSLDYVEIQKPTTYDTGISLAPSSGNAKSYGDNIRIHGQLDYTDAVGDHPVPDPVTVALSRRDAGTTTWVPVGTTQTSGGTSSFQFTEPADQNAEFQVAFPGNATYGPSQSRVVVGVRRVVSSASGTTRRGRLFLAGGVAPSYTNEPVSLMRKPLGRVCAGHRCAWQRFAATTQTSPRSTYRFGALLAGAPQAKAYCLLVRVPADTQHLASYSTKWLAVPGSRRGPRLRPARQACG